MRRRYAEVLAGVTGARLLLAACADGADQGPATSDQPAAAATAWALSGGSDVVLEGAFDQWNREHPGEEITVSWLENDAYKARIGEALDAGDPPTLILGWAGSDLDRLVADDAVVDLTDAVEPVLDRVLPAVAANGEVDGRTYAVPNNQTQPVVLYHNAEVLEAAGVEPPETYDDLLAAVPVLEEAGVLPIALAGGSRWPELMYLQYLTDRIGGPEVFQRVVDGEPGAWSDPAILEALRLIRELVDAGAFGEYFTETVADGSGDVSLVATGNAAFVLQGAWVYPDFLESDPALVARDGLGFAPFPVVDGGTGDPDNVVGNPANVWSVSAAASPEAQQVAIDFLVEQTYAEREVERFLVVRTVPPVRKLDRRLDGLESEDYLRFVHDMVASAPHFQLSWDQALPADQSGPLLDNLHRVFTGELTARGFADAMDETL
ncbi:extracellular solute-binding protein [Isoptericola halotolerans]|uniref:ABC transporter substrate-binding protein n=1 Tax=Isoptericola halotolerans TaxID=300560 RepID=UPI003890FBE0